MLTAFEGTRSTTALSPPPPRMARSSSGKCLLGLHSTPTPRRSPTSPPSASLVVTQGELVSTLQGRNKADFEIRKVGQVQFNPSAENILASASGDFTIKLWDITTGQSPLTLKHSDIVQSLSWNASGTQLVTTSRDKKIRVWDVRQERPVHEAPGHGGAKNSRAVWMGDHNRFATTGFSRMSERQIALWEPGQTEPIGGFTMLDSISGVCMPFWGRFWSSSV